MAASQFDLSTVGNVQDYLVFPADSGTATPRADTAVRLQRLLTAASVWLAGLMHRNPLLVQTYTDVRDGKNGQMMRLRQWPAKVINGIYVDGYGIPQGSYQVGEPAQPGWFLSDPNQAYIKLVGYEFCRGVANVQVPYVAGLAPVYGLPWAQGSYNAQQVIVDSNGNAELCITGGATGASVPNWPTKPLTITQDGQAQWQMFLPDTDPMLALEQGVLELVAQKWKRAAHVDETSQTAGQGMTTAFLKESLPLEVRNMIDEYKNVVPVGY
jgi:hypothetical protein